MTIPTPHGLMPFLEIDHNIGPPECGFRLGCLVSVYCVGLFHTDNHYTQKVRLEDEYNVCASRYILFWQWLG